MARIFKHLGLLPYNGMENFYDVPMDVPAGCVLVPNGANLNLGRFEDVPDTVAESDGVDESIPIDSMIDFDSLILLGRELSRFDPATPCVCSMSGTAPVHFTVLEALALLEMPTIYKQSSLLFKVPGWSFLWVRPAGYPYRKLEDVTG